jgi:ERF superfamily
MQGDDMSRSPEINELVAALAKARPQFKAIVKDTENRAFNYKYATLEEVQAAVVGPLAEQGLVLSYEPDYSELGETGVITYLFHTSGQWLSALIWLGKPELDGQKGLSVAQRIGSVLTYGCRYGTLMVTGCQPQGEDDDAMTDGQKLKSDALKGATAVDKAEQKAIERHEARQNRAEGIEPSKPRASAVATMNQDQAYHAVHQRLCVLAQSDQERDLLPYLQQAFGTGMTSLDMLRRQGKTALIRGLERLDAMPVHSELDQGGDTPVDPSGPASRSAGGPPQGTSPPAQERPSVMMAGKERTNTTSASGSTATDSSDHNGHPDATLEADVIEPVAKDLFYDDDGHLLPESLDLLLRWSRKYYAAELVQGAIERHGGVTFEDCREIKRDVNKRRLAQRQVMANQDLDRQAELEKGRTHGPSSDA